MIDKVSTRRVSRVQLGVGSTLCFTTSFVAHGATSDAETTPAENASEVVITGHPSISAYGSSLQNTAQNVTVVTEQTLNDQAVNNLQDALKNVPGITLNAGEGGTHGDNINLRGFAASDDFFLDGLRDTGFYTRDSFNVEAIEVYKGPASTLFGRGSTGGVVNQVSKAPVLDDFLRGTAVAGTNSEIRGTTDLNYKFGDTSAVRFAAMGQRSLVTDRDFVETRRWGIAPSVAFGIGTSTNVTVKYLHQAQNDIPDYGIPFAFGRPVPVPRETYYGLPTDDRSAARVDVGTLLFKQTFNDNLWLTDNARVGNYFFESRETAAHYGTAPPAPGTPLDTVLTFRDRPTVAGTVHTLMNDADLHFTLATGAMSQHFVLGFEADREEAHLARFANQLNTIPGTPLLNPDPFEPFPGHQSTITQRPDTVTRTLSGLFEDIVELGPQWEVAGAVRVDRFNASYNEPLTKQHYEHTDTISSPRVSVIYKPMDSVSVYASYGTSYDPSAENLSLSAATASLAPEKDRTFELGGKSTLADGRLAVQAAVFQTQMTNARVGDPTNPTAPQILAGEQRVRGFEADAIGHLTEQLEITSGYTHLDSRTVKATDRNAVGQPLLNTAPNQANVWLDIPPTLLTSSFATRGHHGRRVYEFKNPFKVGGGLNFLERRPADLDNTAHVPSYITLDGMVAYRPNRHIALQLNGYNLTNKYYFANSYFSSPVENHVVPGAGRAGFLTLSFGY